MRHQFLVRVAKVINNLEVKLSVVPIYVIGSESISSRVFVIVMCYNIPTTLLEILC